MMLDKTGYTIGTPMPCVDDATGASFTPSKGLVTIYSTGDLVRILVFYMDFEAGEMDFIYLYNNQYNIQHVESLSFGGYFTAIRSGNSIILTASNGQQNSYLNTGRFTLFAWG